MGWTSWNGKILEELTDQQINEALVETAEATLGQALQLVPLDEGTLEETGMTKVNPNNSHDVAISFGGGFGTPYTRVPYAVKHHEIPQNFQHGRQHNYLKQPIDNFTPVALKKNLIKKLKEAWS